MCTYSTAWCLLSPWVLIQQIGTPTHYYLILKTNVHFTIVINRIIRKLLNHQNFHNFSYILLIINNITFLTTNVKGEYIKEQHHQTLLRHSITKILKSMNTEINWLKQNKVCMQAFALHVKQNGWLDESSERSTNTRHVQISWLWLHLQQIVGKLVPLI